MPVATVSLVMSPCARRVRVNDGAIALTRTFGASSAASASVSPSTAPLAIEMEPCEAKPCARHGREQHDTRRLVSHLECRKSRLHGFRRTKGIDAEVLLKVGLGQTPERFQVDGPDGINETDDCTAV